MFTKGKKSGTIRFSFQSPGSAQKVLVAGSFSQWQPLAMKKQKDGSFALTVTVPAGTHEYRFIVDGNWTTDPENDTYVLNPYGSANSVAQAA
jgi:1,4-alpha-glucan branching enzyme